MCVANGMFIWQAENFPNHEAESETNQRKPTDFLDRKFGRIAAQRESFDWRVGEETPHQSEFVFATYFSCRINKTIMIIGSTGNRNRKI